MSLICGLKKRRQPLRLLPFNNNEIKNNYRIKLFNTYLASYLKDFTNSWKPVAFIRHWLSYHQIHFQSDNSGECFSANDMMPLQ